MEENTQNIIRNKYSGLIRLISSISDDVRIEDKGFKFSLTIDVYNNKRQILSFELYQLSEKDTFLSVEWGVLGRTIGHWCFPEYFHQSYMFKKLVSVVDDWYQEVINSNIDNLLKQAQDKIK